MLIDVFNDRLLRAVEVTAMLETMPTMPQMLGNYGEALFPTRRIRTRLLAIGKKDGVMSLIPTSPIGAPPVELELYGRDVRPFSTRRVAKGSTLYAEELTGVINAPDDVILRTVQQELAERGQAIKQDFELTHEHMRFGAVQGKVIEADGTTVLDDWFANWGVAEPTAFNFHLNVTTTNIRLICDQVIEATRIAGRGAWVEGQTRVVGLCGSSFFTQLVTHPMVERLYMNWAAAADLAGRIDDDFPFGGILWRRFRGTDDGTTIAIATDEVKFFPLGARDAFQRAMSPAEFMPFIGEPGRDIYGITFPDRDRGAWTRIEDYCYPLYVCLRPAMLQKGVAS